MRTEHGNFRALLDRYLFIPLFLLLFALLFVLLPDLLLLPLDGQIRYECADSASQWQEWQVPLELKTGKYKASTSIMHRAQASE